MQLDATLASWPILSQSSGLGNESLRGLLQACGPPEAVLNSAAASLSSHVWPALANAIVDGADQRYFEIVANWLDDPLNHIIAIADDEFPR